MQFGIAIPTAADSWRLVRRAEELGFSHAWFFDTQMLSADPFVAMAAAAMKTSRIKLGTGVLIPSNRIAPVAATAFASLNKLAPGRIIFGVSTGLHRPPHHGPRRGEAGRHGGLYPRRPSPLARRDRGMRARGQAPRDPLPEPRSGADQHRRPDAAVIAASGPKARALTAKLGAGWIDNVADPERGAATLDQMRAAWAQAGRAPEDLTAGRLDRRRGAGRGRARRRSARHGGGRPARGDAAAPRGRHRAGRLPRAAGDAAGVRRGGRRPMSRTRAASNRPTPTTWPTIAAT